MNKFKKHSLCIKYLVVLLISIFYTSHVTFAESVAIDRVIAVVNDGVIFSSQLEERLRAVRQQFKQNQAPPDDILRQQVLERLIVESLQLQLAERANATVSNEDLQNALQSIARQNDTDIAGLQKKIEAEGLPYKSFTKNIEQEILMQRVQQSAIAKRVVVSDQDVINFLNSEEGKQRTATTYHVAHILLPVDGSASDTEKANVEQLAKYIHDRATNTATPVDFSALAKQYSKAQDANTGGDLGWRKKSDMPSLYIDKIDMLAAGDVSEPFLASGAYHILKMLEKNGDSAQWVKQTHARHILIKPSIIRTDDETVQLLESLRQKILNGADFAETAKKYSEDYGSALKGGDLGWTTPGQLVPQFQEAMDKTAINEITSPFKTQYGWHILQVQERRNQNMGDDMLKQAAKNFLMQRRFQEELPLWLKELRDEAFVDIKDPNNTPEVINTTSNTPPVTQ